MTANDHPGVLIFPPLLFAICFVAGIIALAVCPYRPEFPPWVQVGGGAAGIAAVGLVIWGKRTMEAAGTNVRPDQPALAIVADGPFAFTRNPLYLGVMGMFAGFGIALRSPAFLTVLVPLFLILEFGVVRREERYLETKFGSVYVDYKARVRRWM
jgi:protein-S-isoprenylcysteine O-methyltransferase Ste14